MRRAPREPPARAAAACLGAVTARLGRARASGGHHGCSCVFVVLLLPPLLSGYWINVCTAVAIYSIVALGLGILMGRTGLVSLGQVAILALGAGSRRGCSSPPGLPFPIVLLLTGLITMVLGTLVGLPALRLSGLYLALITLMLAGAHHRRAQDHQLPQRRPRLPRPHRDATAGRRHPPPAHRHGDTAFFRYVVIVAALMFLLALIHVRARPGRAWAAIRQSEPAALAAGVNITLYKMWAFALASFMTGRRGRAAGGRLGHSSSASPSPPGLDHPARRRADGRHLQPVGRGGRGQS